MDAAKYKSQKEKALDGFFYSTAIAEAFILKHYYSRAGSDDLLWILGPVAALVHWMGHMSFSYEPHTGFVSRDFHVIIAPACAGMNLLIVSFTMAIFTGIRHMSDMKKKILWSLFSAVSAYGMVIFVNAVRIYLSVIVFSTNIENVWLTPARCHRLLGIMIYFFFHCLFYLIMKKIAVRCGTTPAISIEKVALSGLMPLGWYLGITLVVPFLNAVYRDNPGQFVEHGLFVVSVSFVILGLFFLIQTIMKYMMVRRNNQGFYLNETKNPNRGRRTGHCRQYSIRPGNRRV